MDKEEDMTEPKVREEFEIDFDYEFDAPQYYDFNEPENLANAELWFEYATSYPPSPFVLGMNWRYDNQGDIASISCHSRAESTSYVGDECNNEMGSEAFAIDDDNRGLELCNDMDQNVPKSKTKSLVKSSLSRSSTLMKPTASYLAKHSHLEEVHYSRFLRSQKLTVKSDKSSLNLSTTEIQDTKRQKLEAGYLRKVAHLKHQTLFLHKVPVKDGLSVHARSKVTIPREPKLETAHRAQRHGARVDAESGGHAKSNACTFKAFPLNRKILEPRSLLSLKKSLLQLPEFEVSQLRTSERGRQHASNDLAVQKAAKVHNYDSISQNETRDSRRLHSLDALKKEKCEAVKKIKANPLFKKICSSKEENDIFQNIKQETNVKDYNFPIENIFLNEPPVELLSKLSLASDVQTNLKPEPKIPLVTKCSKENAPRCFLLEPRFSRNQHQCRNELSDGRIAEGGARFNINSSTS